MNRHVLLVPACILLLAGGCNAEPAGYRRSHLSGVLFINEFMASNRSTIADEAGDYDDWVELHNSGDKDIRLGTVFLTDDLAVPMKWSFPDTVLRAGGYLLIWCDGEFKEGPLHTTFKLNADKGEQLGLFDTDGDRVMFVDTLTFAPQYTDTSFGRIPDGGAWRSLARPTPGAPNSDGASGLRGTLFLNEFLADNGSVLTDERGDYDDWVEIHNAGTEPVRLGGLRLTDDWRSPRKWEFPDTVIPAGGFLLVWCDNEPDEGPLHATFGLNAVTGEQLGLFEPDPPFVLVIDTLRFGPQRTDTSYGRLPDGGEQWLLMPQPTPRRANVGR
jgi:hypothetical protein